MTKKYMLAQLVLLGILIMGLFWGWLIVESRHNRPMKGGAELVEGLKEEGLLNLMSDEGNRTFFLIRNSKGQPIGFTMDLLTVAEPNSEVSGVKTSEPLNVRAAYYVYVQGRYAQEQVGVFQGQSNLGAFIWKNEAVRRTGRTGATITLSTDGVMKVVKSNSREIITRQLAGNEIPDAVIDLLFVRMLDSGRRKIFVDIIEDDGRIVPLMVSQLKSDEAAYSLKVDFLDGSGFSEQVYFDEERRIFRKQLRQQSIFVLERAGVGDIIRLFPERKDYILKKSNLGEDLKPAERSELWQRIMSAS